MHKCIDIYNLIIYNLIVRFQKSYQFLARNIFIHIYSVPFLNQYTARPLPRQEKIALYDVYEINKYT